MTLSTKKEPKLLNPAMDSADPILQKLRTETALPRFTKSRTIIDDHIRQNDLRETELPIWVN
jgi:hypothetical protein